MAVETLALNALLFKGVETIVEKMVETTVWEPAHKKTKERIHHWINKDEESKRKEVFVKAVATARQNTIKTDESKQAKQILNLIDDYNFQDVTVKVADEAVKIMLFSDTPDIDSLAKLFIKYLGYKQDIYAEIAPTPETITRIISIFFENLRSALLDEEPYKSLLTQHEILRNIYEQNQTQLDIKKILLDVFDELRPEYDSEHKYRQQVAVMNRELGFVGIPEVKDSSPITIKDIFVRLRAIREKDDIKLAEDGSNKVDIIDRERLQAQSSEEVLLDEAFKKSSCMIVLGDPGAGKTTLLKHITVICAEKRGEAELGLKAADGTSLLPIFVSLRAFNVKATNRNQDYNLIDYFCTYSYEHLGLKKLHKDFFYKALEAKRCIICLDGLDEVGSVENRAKVRDAVIALANRFPGNKYIVSSRIVGYKEASLNSSNFTQYTITEFQDEDIFEFVSKWYAKREPDEKQRETQINKLIKTIKEEPRIQSLARNPLLLTIITLVHRIEAELPNERVKLYDKCVTALVETWEKVKGLTIEEKQRPFYKCRHRLLEQLAYKLHAEAEEPGQVKKVKEGSLEIFLAEFLMQNRNLGLADDLDTALDEAKSFISLIKGRTGLLIEIGEGIFSFPHLTFQEYLAACDIQRRHIKDKNEIWNKIKEHLHTPHWQEVILLLLGRLNKYDDLSTEIIEQILELGENDKLEPVLHRHLYLVTRAMADRVDVAISVRHKVVDNLLTIVNDDKLFWEWGNAFTALSKLEGDNYVSEKLLTLTRNEQLDARVRLEAAETLKKLNRKEQAVEALLTFAQNQELDARMRLQAAKSLGELNQENQALEVLLALAHDKQLDIRVRQLAVENLKTVNQDYKSINILLALAHDEQLDARLRLSSAESLRKLKRENEAIKILLELAQNPLLDAYLRLEAADSLEEPDQEDQAVEILLELAQNPQVDAGARIRAAINLKKFKQEDQTVEILLEIAQNLQLDGWARLEIADSLQKLNQENQAVELFLAIAQDQEIDINLRFQAAIRLHKINRKDLAVKMLFAFTQNSQLESWVHRWAIKSLIEINREQAIEILLSLAQNPQLNANVHLQVANGLKELNLKDQAIEVLLPLAQNPQLDADVRLQVANGLKELNLKDQAIEVLLPLAQNPQLDADVRLRAAESVAKLNLEDQAIEILLTFAQSDHLDASVRLQAIESLKELKQEEQAADILLALAQNQLLKASVRYFAALSLSKNIPNDLKERISSFRYRFILENENVPLMFVAGWWGYKLRDIKNQDSLGENNN